MKARHLVCTALLIVFVVFACKAQAPWPRSGVFVGYYIHGFEKSDFKPAGTTEHWWLSGNIKSVADLFIASSKDQSPTTKSAVYLVVRGSLSREGQYGHLGAYKRELLVSEVLEVRETTIDEAVAF
jgi:hypothetical protein